jgi:hypothetical protein
LWIFYISTYSAFYKVQILSTNNKKITSGYKPLRALASKSETTPVSLKNLAQALLGKALLISVIGHFGAIHVN